MRHLALVEVEDQLFPLAVVDEIIFGNQENKKFYSTLCRCNLPKTHYNLLNGTKVFSLEEDLAAKALSTDEKLRQAESTAAKSKPKED